MKLVLTIASIMLASYSQAQSVKVWDNCDNVKSENGEWRTGKGTVTADTDKKEGAASISGTSEFPERITFKASKPFSTDVTVADGNIGFWVFIENTDLLKGTGDVAISSNGGASKDSYIHTFGGLKVGGKKLANGWNHIVIPIKDFNMINGSPDLKALNYMRVVFYNKPDVTTTQVFKIDNVRFSKDAKALASN